MTTHEAIKLLEFVLSRVALNPAELAGVRAAIETLRKQLPADEPR